MFHTTDTLNCFILDDEEYAIAGLIRYIERIPQLKLMASYTDPFTALLAIRSGDTVDILFLDVDMPGMSGIEFAGLVQQKVKRVIFTSGHSKYAYDAFQVDAYAYLLKPYDFTKFASTIAKVLDIANSKELKPLEDYFFVKRSKDLKIFKLVFDDVIAVESKGNYVLIHSKRNQILTYIALSSLFQIIGRDPRFVQFQRSFILNVDHIDYIDGNSIYMGNGINVTVGEYYRKNFAKFLAERLIKAGSVSLRKSSG